jgi:CCR4-NOT transcription complex subunit 2
MMQHPNTMMGMGGQRNMPPSSAGGGAPGLSMAGLAGSSMNQYPPNMMSSLGRSTSTGNAYISPDQHQQQQQQQTPGDLFALLNKGSSSAGGANLSQLGNNGVNLGGGSVGSVGPGQGAPGMSGLHSASMLGAPGNIGGSSDVAGLSMVPGGGMDSLSMGSHGAQDTNPFDINEFPALGGAPGTGRISSGSILGGGNFGAYPDSSQQSTEFTSMMSADSFPSLPGSSTHDSGSGQGGGVGSVGGGGGGQTSGQGSDSTDAKQTQYGLLGLLAVIRMMDADLNTLALGSDLTTLGLNLNSARLLYSTFSSPWAEGPSKSDPQ